MQISSTKLAISSGACVRLAKQEFADFHNYSLWEMKNWLTWLIATNLLREIARALIRASFVIARYARTSMHQHNHLRKLLYGTMPADWKSRVGGNEFVCRGHVSCPARIAKSQASYKPLSLPPRTAHLFYPRIDETFRASSELRIPEFVDRRRYDDANVALFSVYIHAPRRYVMLHDRIFSHLRGKYNNLITIILCASRET